MEEGECRAYRPTASPYIAIVHYTLTSKGIAILQRSLALRSRVHKRIQVIEQIIERLFREAMK